MCNKQPWNKIVIMPANARAHPPDRKRDELRSTAATSMRNERVVPGKKRDDAAREMLTIESFRGFRNPHLMQVHA